jgi:hypothetical protein
MFTASLWRDLSTAEKQIFLALARLFGHDQTGKSIPTYWGLSLRGVSLEGSKPHFFLYWGWPTPPATCLVFIYCTPLSKLSLLYFGPNFYSQKSFNSRLIIYCLDSRQIWPKKGSFLRVFEGHFGGQKRLIFGQKRLKKCLFWTPKKGSIFGVLGGRFWGYLPNFLDMWMSYEAFEASPQSLIEPSHRSLKRASITS